MANTCDLVAVNPGGNKPSRRVMPAPDEVLTDRGDIDVLVIGYGNTLRGDDGLGIRVAERLHNSFTKPSVHIIASHQLTFDLADRIRCARFVVLIDAVVGSSPGAITCRRILAAPDSSFTMLHHMQPDALLACTRALYGQVPTMYLWTITGETFGFTESLSPAVQAAVPTVVTRLEEFIFALLETIQGGSLTEPYLR